jgi:outer membrane protein OmpA-like peptidoglycan-associated protein/tetratricopeptide (TPR) repeat protein
MQMKNTIPIAFIALVMMCCSHEKTMLRKASNAVDRAEYDMAASYYDKIIEKDKNSFYGNAGKGIVLSEFLARHEQAIPYLEKALSNSPKKSKPVIQSNLGKSYHYIGNYKRALYYYDKISAENDPKYSDYDEFLAKRIADCHYAIKHPKVALPEHQNIKSIGRPVNTEMAEYTPVLIEKKLYFTSKRQDNPKEKRNKLDGKFFESIYVTELNDDGTFSTPQLMKLPSESNRMRKFGEAVISASADGQILYVYKGGKIYETEVNNLQSVPKKMDKTINFALQNHAFLTSDGKTLYFSAEDRRNGIGGADLYVSTKGDDGTWSDPKILPGNINTPYNEDAPFMSEQGILYFSSNGHPGYGGYDVYKTKKVDGVWAAPENLGQPVNSAGDDVFFSQMTNKADGFYASARPGGIGDLDIYKVHYVITDDVKCTIDSLLTIATEPDPKNPMLYHVALSVPDDYKNNVRSYRWRVNNEEIAATDPEFEQVFSRSGTYTITTQLIVYCDTCPSLIGKCASKTIIAGAPLLTEVDTLNKLTKKNRLAMAKKESESKNQGISEQKQSQSKSASTANNNFAGEQANNNNSGITSKPASSTKGAALSSSGAGTLSESKLKEINWNNKALHFAFDDYSLDESAKEILDENIKALQNNKDLYISIRGFADSRGPETYNRSLSQKRAAEVRRYLVNNGVPETRIRSVKGYGETELLNSCSDEVVCSEDQHQQNRRVVLSVTNGKAITPVTSK